MIAQIGVEENVESMMGYEVMNEGFASGKRPDFALHFPYMANRFQERSARETAAAG